MIETIVFSILISWILCYIVIFASNAFDSMADRNAELAERALSEELNERKHLPEFTIKDLCNRGKINGRSN